MTCRFFPIFDIKKCRDLEIRVRGHSGSLKVVWLQFVRSFVRIRQVWGGLTGFRLFSQDCPETCQNGRCRDSDNSDTEELEQASGMSDRVS